MDLAPYKVAYLQSPQFVCFFPYIPKSLTVVHQGTFKAAEYMAAFHILVLVNVFACWKDFAGTGRFPPHQRAHYQSISVC